uniref:Uncharacterized protein n=2 Tax=Oryza sativa subsp. japonica TaxID=39947 RepID=A0A5S6R973_ORYSJ|nr:unknown protein [Oryza sativa Japonica Group]AAU44077.1 unknown protein [Oryza sativa Japonica Group]BAG99346.1 unnamed protein product [Oryza sativa Japonica Group]
MLALVVSPFRFEAHRQELPSPVGELPPPRPQARPHHRRRGAPHPPPPLPVGQPLVPHRPQPPRPHRQRDQELLANPHAQDRPPRQEEDQFTIAGADDLLRFLVLLAHHGDDDDGDGCGAARKQQLRRRRRGRRPAGGGGHHAGEPAADDGLHHGPALERHRGGGSRYELLRRGGDGLAAVAGLGILHRLLAVEDRRRGVLQEDARCLAIVLLKLQTSNALIQLLLLA